jgi:hypothetical protein
MIILRITTVASKSRKAIFSNGKNPKIGKEKDNDFNEQQKVKNFIQQQKKLDQMMLDFLDKLKNNLEKEKSDDRDEFRKSLEKRIDKATG